MKRILAMVLVFVMGLSLCACGVGEDAAGVSKSTWVSYEEFSSKVKNEENKDIFVYKYQQPIISTPSEGAAMINTKLDNATTAFLYGSGGVEELTELAKMDWREAWFTCYALNREVCVARIDDVVTSFRYSDYSFTGGSHGYTAEYGLSYDMVSGRQLELEDLTQDVWALQQVCRQYITEYLESDDCPYADGLLPNYQSYLETVLNNWLFTDKGLQFIAQPYIIASFATGTLRFTVPYEELEKVLDEKWQPEGRKHAGGTVELRAVDLDQPAPTYFIMPDGDLNVIMQVHGHLYDFSLEEVNSYINGGEQVFYVVQQHLYSPEVVSDSIGLKLHVPEGAPTTMLRYSDGSGREYQYFVTYDGQNGGVALVEVEHQLARE